MHKKKEWEETEMKRKILAALLTSAMVLSLAGCGGGSAETPAAPAADGGAEAEAPAAEEAPAADAEAPAADASAGGDETLTHFLSSHSSFCAHCALTFSFSPSRQNAFVNLYIHRALFD